MRQSCIWTIALGIFVAGLLWSPRASAVKYMSLKQAVKSFLPEEAKVFKTTKTLSAEQKRILSDNYGWRADSDTVKVYLGKDASRKTLAYVFVFRATASDWHHRFAVGLRPDGSVIALRVMELTCDWAYPIRRKSFLKQFDNKRHSDPLTVWDDIDGITRATVSCELAAQATRKAVSLHQMFFADGKPASPSAKIKKARQKGLNRINQANSSGR